MKPLCQHTTDPDNNRLKKRLPALVLKEEVLRTILQRAQVHDGYEYPAAGEFLLLAIAALCFFFGGGGSRGSVA